MTARPPHFAVLRKRGCLRNQIHIANIQMVTPHHRNRKPEKVTQDDRPLRRYRRRWTVERTISSFQNFRRLFIRHEKSAALFQGFLHLGCSIILLKQVCG